MWVSMLMMVNKLWVINFALWGKVSYHDINTPNNSS